ncbi:MAG: hypothetical protein ACOC9D_01145 [Thermodesulfobacteriota bacterium]
MNEKMTCPHCQNELTKWIAPPDSGWGEILVCFNDECPFYLGSADNIINKGEDQRSLGCRYAVDPANKYEPFSMLAVCPR